VNNPSTILKSTTISNQSTYIPYLQIYQENCLQYKGTNYQQRRNHQKPLCTKLKSNLKTNTSKPYSTKQAITKIAKLNHDSITTEIHKRPRPLRTYYNTSRSTTLLDIKFEKHSKPYHQQTHITRLDRKPDRQILNPNNTSDCKRHQIVKDITK
jgi:hypothetical protein